MKIIDAENKITLEELKEMAQKMFGNLVKAVVDVEREIIVLDGELHADEEALLLGQGSPQENLWGINIYPQILGDDWVEFDSLINLRPRQGNQSRGVDDPKMRKRILTIVGKLIKK